VQPEQKNITARESYCTEKDQRPRVCLELKKIDIGREVYVTVSLDPAQAFTTSQFNLNLLIEKRAFDLPLFSESLDEEINKTQKLIEKLQGIIKNARVLHNFWSKFCFITFGVLFTTSFFNNVIGGSRENLAREKVNAVWHERYQKDATASQYGDFDRYVFAHQEKYEQDLARAETILDEAIEGEYTLPKEIEDQFKKNSDEARDYHFYQEMSRQTKTSEAGLIYASKSAALRKEAFDEYTAKVVKEPEFSKIPEDEQKLFEDAFVKKKEFYYQTAGSKIESNDPQRISKLWRITRNDPLVLVEFKEAMYHNQRGKFETELKDDLVRFAPGLTDDQREDRVRTSASQYFPTGRTQGKKQRYILPIEINKENDAYTYTEAGTSYTFQKEGNNIKKQGKLVDADGKETSITYVLADTPQMIETKYRSEHAPAVSLVQEGRNQGKVEVLSIDSRTYMEVKYNDAGIPIDYRVFERLEDNDALSTSDVSHLGNYQEAYAYYNEKGKENPIYKQKAAWLDEAKQCIGIINKNIAGKKLKPGEPIRSTCKAGTYTVQQAVKPLGSSCTDAMDPDNCKLLFNACDPVICPSSRCNLGGKWQVDNVVQTGLVGSIALCAPNWFIFPKGDIYTLPVCLTGIVAGLENVQSILESYKQCLITAKVDGKSLGLCDSLRNFYLCDTLWREASALLNIEHGLLGVIGEEILGDKEGGEYTNFKANFDRSIKSLDYFTKDYAKQVFASYQGASFDEIGTEVCKAAIYGKAPNIGQFMDEVMKPESPPQYTAFYNEKFYSDIKGYRENQYTVQYHIYAGSRASITYSVWMQAVDLQEQPLPNLPLLIITRGKTLNAGQFATETKPLTAPEGYNQVCVETRSERYGVDRQCGFGKTTTDFGINYLIDEYVTSEAGVHGITRAEDCVPENKIFNPQGRTFTSALTSDGKQSVAPAIYSTGIAGLGSGLTSTGIIRRCSAYNPGIGGGERQWATVGTCGRDDKGRDLGTCWMYTGNLIDQVQYKDNAAEIQQTIVALQSGDKAKQLEALGVELLKPEDMKAQLTIVESSLATVNPPLPLAYDAAEYAKRQELLRQSFATVHDAMNRGYDPEQLLRASYLLGYAHEQQATLLLWVRRYQLSPEESGCVRSQDFSDGDCSTSGDFSPSEIYSDLQQQIVQSRDSIQAAEKDTSVSTQQLASLDIYTCKDSTQAKENIASAISDIRQFSLEAPRFQDVLNQATLTISEIKGQRTILEALRTNPNPPEEIIQKGTYSLVFKKTHPASGSIEGAYQTTIQYGQEMVTGWSLDGVNFFPLSTSSVPRGYPRSGQDAPRIVADIRENQEKIVNEYIKFTIYPSNQKGRSALLLLEEFVQQRSGYLELKKIPALLILKNSTPYSELTSLSHTLDAQINQLQSFFSSSEIDRQLAFISDVCNLNIPAQEEFDHLFAVINPLLQQLESLRKDIHSYLSSL
ncbi:MAG: hypothetical protein AABX86_01365, partial [Nanoarchaeota archaeon]